MPRLAIAMLSHEGNSFTARLLGRVQRATGEAGALAGQMKACRSRFFIHLPTPAEGIAQALAAGKFPVAVGDGSPATDAYGPPVPFAGTSGALGRVLALTEGKYRNTEPMIRGVISNFGPTALLSLAGTSGGRTVKLICVKAKNHFRAPFKALLADIIVAGQARGGDVDCLAAGTPLGAPGPAALEIRGFRFRHAPASLYPLSE